MDIRDRGEQTGGAVSLQRRRKSKSVGRTSKRRPEGRRVKQTLGEWYGEPGVVLNRTFDNGRVEGVSPVYLTAGTRRNPCRKCVLWKQQASRLVVDDMRYPKPSFDGMPSPGKNHEYNAKSKVAGAVDQSKTFMPTSPESVRVASEQQFELKNWSHTQPEPHPSLRRSSFPSQSAWEV